MFLNGKILFENLVKDKQILMVTNSFNRYIWLVDLIYRTGKISFEEINHKWILSPLSDGNPLPLRTFHNHRIAIEKLFDINIECDKQTYNYYIENIDDIKNAGVRTWLLNTFAVNNLISETQKIKHRIVFENIPSGQHFLAPIIESMRDGLTIEITYHPYWKDEPSTFEIEPYFVKIFKQRWYFIGRSTYDDRIRIYALDRIHFMIATKTQFDLPVDFNPEDYFINCFGIIADETVNVQKVFIKVLGSKVKYLRSLPLHQSQQEIVITENYSIFQYYIRPTYDFRQELLSHGSEIEVLAPDKLREELRNIVDQLLNLYK